MNAHTLTKRTQHTCTSTHTCIHTLVYTPTQKGKGGRKKKESKKRKVKAVQKKQYAGVDKEFAEPTQLKESPSDIIIAGTPPTNRASTEVLAQGNV